MNRIFRERGIAPFPGSVAFARLVKALGLRIGVVTSSGNCDAVLSAAGIQDLFDGHVDADVARRLSLAGKPAPDTYLECARELGLDASRAVVVEDALAGVQAGRAGRFGLVIGVARKGDARALRENGADLVVDDLAELAG